MKRDSRSPLSPILAAVLTAGGAATIVGSAGPVMADSIQEVRDDLNKTKSVVGTIEIKSYPIIFEAYLDLSKPPMEVGPSFNHNTIHPGMDRWSEVSGWAESNPAMAEAILASEDKTLFGLPYDPATIEDSRFRDADLVAEIGADGSLRINRFPYLHAIDTVVAYATAEAYRLFEAGHTQEAIELTVATIFLARQCCDREFLVEQLHSVAMLTEMLANIRDMAYTYMDDVAASQFREGAIKKIPYLRPDRSRLLIPEGDRRVSEALIAGVFDAGGQADRDKFAATFAAIQSEDAPLTRFGAARRWRMIAEVHDSLDAAQDRLELVYDDWWRRWRIEEYDPILDLETEFERTNPIRYAAVIYSMRDIEQLFGVRNELIAAVNGTAMALGLCSHYRALGTYPPASDQIYTQFVSKRSDRDPFDTEFLPFKYRLVDSDFPIKTPVGRIRLKPGDPILYSKGKNHVDDRGREHTDDGAAGDIVMWPPIKALNRLQGNLR